MRKLRNGEPIPGLEMLTTPLLPKTNDWFGRFRSQANQSNDYLIDRDAQRGKSYSGLSGIEVQDHAVVESMGGISDRTKEHLAPSDRMITVTRRRMLRAVRAHQVEGVTPPGVENPDVFRGARGGSFVAPDGSSWLDLYAARLERADRARGAGVLRAAE